MLMTTVKLLQQQQQRQGHPGQVAATPGVTQNHQAAAAQLAAANALNGTPRLNMPAQLAAPLQNRIPGRTIQTPGGTVPAVSNPLAVGTTGLVPPLPLAGIPQAQ